MNANLNEAAADLETLAKEGKHPPEHGPYKIKVNGTPHVVHEPTITVAQIIALAGKAPPENYWVFRRKHGHQEQHPLPPEKPIDLREHGVESFIVLPKHNPDGLDNPRRDFALSERDIATLEALELPWEAVREGTVCRLVIYGFHLPDGYTAREVDVAIVVEPGYPDTAMDMAFFSPALVRSNGREISKTTKEDFCGRSWQRWSRHRQPPDQWMPGVDDLASHLACVRIWLSAEVTR